MSKILITGGAGYIGAVLTPYLLNKGHKVTVIDLLIYGKDVLRTHPNLRIIEGDIRNKNLLEEILPNHDIVIHLACISNDPSFELNPKLGKSINLDAFTPLVEIAKKNSIKKSTRKWRQNVSNIIQKTSQIGSKSQLDSDFVF